MVLLGSSAAMKTLPKMPYLGSMSAYYRQHYGTFYWDGYREYWDGYREWLSSHGFKVPVHDVLEFPDDFSDQDLLLFQLRWS